MIPWITSADIVDGSIATPRSWLTEVGLANSAASIARPGTVLLVTRTKIGKVTIASRAISFSQDITAITPDRASVDAGYLCAFLKSQRNRLEGQARGATIKGVPQSVVAATEIPLPPLDEQRRIARVLSAAEQLLAKRRETLDLVDGMTSSTFVSMFGDPVTNPHGFPLAGLGTLGALERGVSKHRPRNAPQLLGGPYPLIQTGDVARSGGVITTYSSTYSDEGLKQSRLWPAGTLCITIAANIAKTGVITFDACFPDSVVGFTAAPPMTAYVQAWLSFLQPTLERSAPVSAQKNINLAILRGLPVPTPPAAALGAFAERVRAIGAASRVHAVALRQLEALSASLKDRAFTGAL